MKRIQPTFLASVAAASLATVLAACGSYSSGGSGGSSGTGGASGAGSGGTTAGSGGSTASGGAPGSGGSSASAGGSNAGGSTTATGGSNAGGASAGAGGSSPATGGARSGGTTGSGGSTGVGGTSTAAGGTTAAGGATGAGGSTGVTLPCDVLATGTTKCVSAHSTVRVIVTGYTGPLYELCKGTASTGPNSCKGTKQDIGSKDGYGDVAAHEAFCPTGTSCTITKIYDQSGMKNDLEPAPQGGVCGPDKPANAGDLKVTIKGHSAYGVLIKAGMGYRTGCGGCTIKTGNGTAKGDEPQTMYMITSQKDQGAGQDGCCFDYGNAETSSHDDGNGTMETIYFGAGVVWGTGYGGKPGPWVEADLENGLYAGWDGTQVGREDKDISTNKPLKFDFVTAVVLGDTRDKNGGKGRFALYGADATGADATYGKIATMYDGIRPAKPGYVPMLKQGSIILGIGGDNSCGAGGRFYEGAVTAGPVVAKETVDLLQSAIVAASYGK